MSTIKELRQAGNKVRVTHYRCIYMPYERALEMMPQRVIKEMVGGENFGKYITPNGGMVTVEVTAPDGKEYKAEAKCSLKDNYDKKLGVKIALGRLNLAT